MSGPVDLRDFQAEYRRRADLAPPSADHGTLTG
jgi:hypothetical protein